ncbi:MAG: SRPBCC family protein [Bacteroidota bacterium]|nr:SRPBCC family protein [Bacteroidota bacterium]
MRFTCTTEVDLPLQTTVSIFNNRDNLGKWQQGLVSDELISGIPGEAGSKSRLVFDTGKHVIELTETILSKNLPAEMKGLYEHKHMVNTMSNRFTPAGENKTRYDAEIEYTKFIGFMPKIMALLMPGIFKKQVQKTLDRFKIFAENEAKGNM